MKKLLLPMMNCLKYIQLMLFVVLITCVASCGKSYDSNSESSGSNVPDGYVDLGLPSGTLWAACNVGASNPEDAGCYLAWGETKTKGRYNWDTYEYYDGSTLKFGSGEGQSLTKYCSRSGYGNNGFSDDLTVLLPKDDAATVILGGDARIPTKEEWQELINNSTGEWVVQNGIHGYQFTGRNSNTIFLPDAGLRIETDSPYMGHYEIFYWSSSLDADCPKSAWRMYNYTRDTRAKLGSYSRETGFPVRPVRSKR